jgi:hypothetical protein
MSQNDHCTNNEKKQVIIAGLQLTKILCERVNDKSKPIPLSHISKEPATTIYKTENEQVYRVNIMAHLPNNLSPLERHSETCNYIESGKRQVPTAGIILDNNDEIFLNYNGVSNVLTSVDKEVILCRDFRIEFDCNDPIIEKFDLYSIQFEYKLLPKSFQSVEAVVVHLVNDDPETSRGTVVTLRDEDN